MKRVTENVLKSKGTSAIGLVTAILGIAGIEVDPYEMAAVHHFIVENSESLAFIAVSLLGFLGKDAWKEDEGSPSVVPTQGEEK